MRSLVFSVAVLIACSATADVITFEDFAGHSCPAESGGFEFKDINEFPCEVYTPSFTGNTGNALHTFAYIPTGISMVSLEGKVFSLNSLDIWGLPTVVTGYYVGGGTVETNINPPLPGPNTPYTAVVFDSSWQDLERIVFSTEPIGFFIDNINVSVVPIPAAIWFFGSALAGLGWLRKKVTRPN